jgi:MarR family transcriptional regulator, organic hydroperoxide resistance regulator
MESTVDELKTTLVEEIFKNFQKIANMGGFRTEAWMELDLTIGQLKSLFFIDSEGITHFKSVANALGVTPPSVTGIIDRLVAQGLVSREENPENRRMQILKTTSKGKDLLTRLIEIRKGKMNSVIGQLSLQDLADLARISNSLVNLDYPRRRSKADITK